MEGQKKKDGNASDTLRSFKERKDLEGWSSEVTAAFRNKRWLPPSLAKDKSVLLRPSLSRFHSSTEDTRIPVEFHFYKDETASAYIKQLHESFPFWFQQVIFFL